MVPLVIAAAILLLFITEKPLATTIERDILAESLDIDGADGIALSSVPPETPPSEPRKVTSPTMP